MLPYLESVYSKEYSLFFIAYIKEKHVGYIWFEAQYLPENQFSYEVNRIYIHQLSVHENYRKLGGHFSNNHAG